MAQSDGPRSVFDQKSRAAGEKLYFGMIDRAAEARSDRIISNGKPAHAVYLIHKFFTIAQREVKVFTGRLARQVDGVLAYGDPEICNAAAAFLRRGGTLSILVGEDVDVDEGSGLASHPLFKRIFDDGLLDRVRIAKQLKPDAHWPYHFLVVDEAAHRIETDNERAEAIVSFNRPHIGKQINQFFQEWMDAGQAIDLREGATA